MTDSTARSGQPSSTEGLIDQAAQAFEAYLDGSRERMGELVDLLTPILWHTARAQGVGVDIAEDVVQTAWLRLVDHAEAVRDSRTVLAWLMTTVRREAWRIARRDTKQDLGVHELGEVMSQAPSPETVAMLDDRQRRLWTHVSALSHRCQHLLRVIAFAQRPDYTSIAEALGMPLGSIGPTRGRCLDQLRQALVAGGFSDGMSDNNWGVQ